MNEQLSHQSQASDKEFAQLLEESLAKVKMYSGAVITATVITIDRDYVTLDAGLKSESVVPIHEFQGTDGELEVSVGDTVEVVVETPEDGYGETILSREKAKRMQEWRVLETAHKNNDTIMGMIVERVKGGFTVEVGQVRAFLPGSLVDIRPVRDLSYLEGKELEFKVIKMDPKRNNIVVSRRAVVEEEGSVEREALLESLEEGQEVAGIVKNLTDYGAFIDLGGVDGLLHITDICWKRVKHPSEVLNVGQEIKVKILSYDRERKRVSLGMKQLSGDPWTDLIQRYSEGGRLNGVVTNVTDYGCFVEIEEGVEGLVHMSEMDWTNKNIHPSKVVQVGDEVEVMVLEIDQQRRRISLGIKQCRSNPWEAFAEKNQKGDVIVGKIRSITDFGIFVGLEGDIDGLIHSSDISWEISGEEAVKQYKKGQEIEAIILAVDAAKERISLGIKQLQEDAVTNFCEQHAKNDSITGTVLEVTDKQANVALATGVVGILRAGELPEDGAAEITKVLQVDQEIQVRILTLDKKGRKIFLSMRAADTRKNIQQDVSASTKTTLGDLIKEKIEEQSSEQDKE